MTDEYTVGPDVDLEREDVRDSKGRRITNDYVERAAEYDPAQVRRGRPSLSGGRRHSPRVSFRVPDELQVRAGALAAARGQTVSRLAREALEYYVTNVSLPAPGVESSGGDVARVIYVNAGDVIHVTETSSLWISPAKPLSLIQTWPPQPFPIRDNIRRQVREKKSA